jgi:hypothetical protein
MEKENTKDGRNDLELPKLVGDKGMGDGFKFTKLKRLSKKFIT